MSTVYVASTYGKLSLKSGQVVIDRSGEKDSLPLQNIDSFVVIGNIQLTAQLIHYCLAHHIPILFLSRTGAYFGRLSSTNPGNISKLRYQFRRSDDKDFCLSMARTLLKQKLTTQATQLTHLVSADSQNARDEVKSCINDIRNYRYAMDRADRLETILGFEGMAACRYFQGLSLFIDSKWGFHKRTRRPPRDPVNSLLSFGYTLLMYELYTDIELAGLYPYCGFIHQDRENHPTLASDMMEEWRARIVDTVVIQLIRQDKVDKDDFETDADTGGVIISNRAMGIFLHDFNARLEVRVSYTDSQSLSYREIIRRQVEKLTQAILVGDMSLYQPLEWR